MSDITQFPAYRSPLTSLSPQSSEGHLSTPATTDSCSQTLRVPAASGDMSFLPNASRNVLVVGSSGHARVVIDLLIQLGTYSVSGVVDSYVRSGTVCGGILILGTEHDVARLIEEYDVYGLVVAIGDNYVRMQMVETLKKAAPESRFITAIHPHSYVAPDVRFGEGTVVMAGAVINSGSVIKDHCIINTNASLDHDSVMEDYSSLGPRAATGGNVTLGKFTAVSLGANVIHGINIGEHTLIGAGSTVVRDIPSNVVALGLPARVTRPRRIGERYL